MLAWLSAFGFTQIVECPIYWAAQRGHHRSVAAKLLIAFGASAITHPVVWFVIPRLWLAAGRVGGYWGMAVVAEAFAIAVEGAYLSRLGVKRPFVWALGANLASVTLGLLSRGAFGWP